MATTALVVLGCRVLPSGRPGAAALRRVQAAARAWHQGMATCVVASGGRRWGEQIEASVLRQELMRLGVPGERVREELCSLSTRENALLTTAILRRLGVDSALVVTCDWHMPRALSNFEALGITAMPWPAPAPPAPPWTRVLRHVHERIGAWLDGKLDGAAGALVRARQGAT